MLTRMRTVHTHNSIKMKKKEIDAQDCRLGSPFALFHMVNLRCRVATSHVWMCTVYVLICLGSWRGAAECVWVLRYQSCWTYLAPHRVSKQTRGRPFKHACRVGWAGCTLFFFSSLSPLNSFTGSICTSLKQTHSPSGMTDFAGAQLSEAKVLQWFAQPRDSDLCCAEIYWALSALPESCLAK